MPNFTCPNCGGNKWKPHVCEHKDCIWQVCVKCGLIADMIRKRIAINSQTSPLFKQL